MPWKLLCLVLLAAAQLQLGTPQLEHPGQGSCPFPYTKHSQADVLSGSLPYLFGGERTPCNSCKAEGERAAFCQFRRPVIDS